jgi:hypothetical protein
MWWLAPAEDCDEEPLKGLASLESTTLLNMANLQKSKDEELGFVAHTCHHSMGFFPPLAYTTLMSIDVFFQSKPLPCFFITSSTYFSYK